MKKDHLQQLIKEELSKALREEVKVSTELDSYIKDNPFNKENSFFLIEMKSFNLTNFIICSIIIWNLLNFL